MQRKGGGYEISTRVWLESGVCTKYIKVLLELGILKKETPITEKPGKKTVYMIEDNFFRFWYRFVPGNMSAIHAGRMEQVYEQAVKNTIRIIWGCGSKGRSYAADDGGSLPAAAVRQGVYLRIKKGMVLGKSSCQGGSFL
ncbi:hypothetical protein AAA088_12865 [Hominifimenecus microfluidus]|uniref:hypothetical protein n=1 Tax=Hominifimenecus microfluidus TaxID=2885348 RepID=UPI0032C002AF